MENINEKRASHSYSSIGVQQRQAEQKYEAFINTMTVLIQKYGQQVLEKVEGAA